MRLPFSFSKMAFVPPTSVTPTSIQNASHTNGHPAIKCSVSNIPWARTAASTAATLLVSATLLATPAHAADDKPLIFDHDQTLSGADFNNRSDLKGSIFSKANCRGASFVGSDLTNAQLDDANLIGANLENVTAINVTATKAKFQKANLKNADFTNANLVSAIFDGANIEGADFTDSLIDRVATIKMCKVAKGVNPKTGVSTAESLMCPDAE